MLFARSLLRTVTLLLASNVFMTFAWYGHLKFKNVPIWKAILASWFVALFEYCLQVPANRWGHGAMSASQLKILQEVITLLVFAGFSTVYLGEQPRWNHVVSFFLVVLAVGFAFWPAEAAVAVAQAPVL